MNKILVAILLFVSSSLLAQNKLNKFEKEIIAYEKQDSLAMPAKGQILFIGSSSFRLWKTFSADMKGLPPAINRGFGGSTLAEALTLAGVLTLIEAFPLVIALNSVEALILEEALPFGEALNSVEGLTLEGGLNSACFIAMCIPELVSG